MKRILFLLVLIPVSLVANELPAYYPQNFKQNVFNSTSDGEIKKLLRKVLISSHVINNGKPDTLVSSCSDYNANNCYGRKVLTYREARKIMFGKLDLKRNKNGYFVKDVYCEKDYGPNQDDRANVGPGTIPNANVMNCEHTWPQSKFNASLGKERQKTDLHHLYPSNSKANSTRGHYNFAMVNGETLSGCNTSSIGSPLQNMFRDYYFQPPKNHRGNVARALFYFSVRYQLKIEETEEKFLRQWHKQDPVDSEEMARNDGIQEAQGNRNPFVDLPSIVEKISDF